MCEFLRSKTESEFASGGSKKQSFRAPTQFTFPVGHLAMCLFSLLPFFVPSCLGGSHSLTPPW